MKSLDFALHVFSSVCTVPEESVARASESVSEMLTAQGTGWTQGCLDLGQGTWKRFPASYCMSFHLIK